MFLIENIKIGYLHDNPEALAEHLSRLTGRPLGRNDFQLWRRSLDARARSNIHFNYSVVIDDPGLARSQAKILELDPIEVPLAAKNPPHQPIVIGFGPAGIFAAYYLARAGLQPIVLERGASLEERVAAVNTFWQGGVFDPENNVQFGEGGAGTFSDGKLTARTKDPASRFVRDILIQHGADPSIAYESRAHLGTDRLRHIIPSIRKEIERLGGKVFFGQRAAQFHISNGQITGVSTQDGTFFSTRHVVLAIGHSARDTFATLLDSKIFMEPKPFAIGVRIEHRQDFMDRSCYGKQAQLDRLPPADYTLSHQVNGRGCYSFCMCPGGMVVNASSEPDGVVVNGMSYSRRNGVFANSALVVSVAPEDFYQGHPLDGVHLQREIEQRARQLCGHSQAPASDLLHFLDGRRPTKLAETSFEPSVAAANLCSIFPGFVLSTIASALPHFERTIPHFAAVNPLCIAPETRTSSPVRITRNNEHGESISTKGLFPAGEGAGYAGGIISAAVDGWRVAQKLIAKINLAAFA